MLDKAANASLSAMHHISQFTFNTTDYVVFVLMLCISIIIGIYFGFFGHGADNTEEYLLGGRKMKTIPIAISLVASQLSAISIMTIPTEMYYFGINWAINIISMLVVIPLLCWVVVPVFYKNNISNCYEYLDMRFDRKTRELLTFGFMGNLIAMLPVFIFIPALAFSQVSGLNIHLINGVICSICVFYTMLGGIKAVVWTDVVQAAIMMVSVVLVGILGAIKVGGFGEVFRIAREGGRLDLTWTFDATTRASVWSYFSNSTIFWCAYVGFNQSCVQRIVALPSLNHARRALLIFALGYMLVMSFNCFTGIVMFARYHDCDPVAIGYVQKIDKMMPFFVQDIVGNLMGMPGVFISCVFSAALSTMSASLNSLAGVVYFDYIKPYIKHTERKANLIMRAFICLCGVYCIVAGVVVERFSSILQMVYSIGGVTMGAVFGVFMLGLLFPQAHARAAFWSVIASMLTMLIIVIGAQGRLHYKMLPVSVENCPAINATILPPTPTTSTKPPLSPSEQSFNVFNLSFNWYVVVGAAIVFIVGLVLSYILPPEKERNLNRKLLSPTVRTFVKYERANANEMIDLKKATTAL